MTAFTQSVLTDLLSFLGLFRSGFCIELREFATRFRRFGLMNRRRGGLCCLFLRRQRSKRTPVDRFSVQRSRFAGSAVRQG